MRYLYFVLGLIARIAVIAIPLFVFNHYRQTLSSPYESWPPLTTFYLSASIAILIAFDYLKDTAKAYKAKRKYNPLLRASRESSATILKLLESGSFTPKAAARLIESALVNIENIVEIALNKHKHDGSEISANCMIYRTQRGGDQSLALVHWGTKLAGREPLTLPANADLPGAPKAFTTRTVTYINDTSLKNFREFFRSKSYKSIVSIPLCKGSKTVGVVNIDSTETKFYGASSSFEREVLPLISGQLELIKFLLPLTGRDRADAVVIKGPRFAAPSEEIA